MFPLSRRVVILGGKVPYYKKVLGIQPANLIGFWRLNETAGAVAVDISSRGNNGAFKGAGEPLLANTPGPDGVLVPYFDGTDDYVNLYSAGFAADFNPNEGTMAAWAKVSDLADWTDATGIRTCFSIMDNAASTVHLSKPASSFLEGVYTTFFRQLGSQTDTTWMHLAITWSQTANQMIFYKDAIQISTIGAFPAALIALFASGSLIGRTRSDIAGQGWKGWLGSATVWTTPLTPEEITILANP